MNAKFREGCAIFGTLNLLNFYEKYYKTFTKNSRKKVKKYYAIVLCICFHHVISFTSSPFGVSSLFCHMQRPLCRDPQIANEVLNIFISPFFSSEARNSSELRRFFFQRLCLWRKKPPEVFFCPNLRRNLRLRSSV